MALRNQFTYLGEVSEPTSSVFTVMPTFDYYINDNNYIPFVGAGLGVFISSTDVDITRFDTSVPSERKASIDYDNQFGGFIRLGLEGPRARFGIEYNYAAPAELFLPDGVFVGKVSNRYLGVSVGFVLG